MAKTVQSPPPRPQRKPDRPGWDKPSAHLVGGGIASLASAAYLIRDGGVPGENICIYEETDVLGGSLDGEGSPEHNYVIRGGRMFTEEAYTCMFDLLSFIPSLTAPGKSIKDEIYEFNARVRSHSHSRLVRNEQKIDASVMGFSNKDRLDLVAIMATSEESLGAKRIEDLFEPSFFKTNFWYMWCTTFAFQPWRSAICSGSSRNSPVSIRSPASGARRTINMIQSFCRSVRGLKITAFDSSWARM